MFDVSHMAELLLKGPDALANVQMLLTNDFSDMEDGQVRYSPMCNENGGVVDDLIVYKVQAQSRLLGLHQTQVHHVPNAARYNNFYSTKVMISVLRMV